MAIGPQLPTVTTQQTLAAHGCRVQSHWDDVRGRLIHKVEGKPGLWPPWCSPKQQPVPVSNHPSRGQHHMAGVKGTCEGRLKTWGVAQGLLHLHPVKGRQPWWGSIPLGTYSQPGWMVAKHPIASHMVIITLLMHPSQQVVDLYIGGCSHRHA